MQTISQVRDRALQATDAPVALLDGADPLLAAIWVNEAFTRVTGRTAADVHGYGLLLPVADGLAMPDVTPASRPAELDLALRPGTPCGRVLPVRRADGSLLWCRVIVSPVSSTDGGPVTHWVAVLQDLTEQRTHEAAQEAAVAEERRERRSLALVAQVSDLLMDLDDPRALREIASLLRQSLVGWAGFYLADGGLRPVEGADPHPHAHLRTTRHTAVVPDGAEKDPVQRMLDGQHDRPVEIDLDAEHLPGSPSAWLAAHAGPHPGDPAVGADGVPLARPVDRRVVVLPITGRRQVSGLLVVQPHGGGGRPALEDGQMTVLELVARRVGTVLDNVRLYEREHRLAEALQRAMLPEQAEVDGLDVWTYYAPNSANAQVGGDWYDVLQMSPDVVGVVIGDVVGHDVEAAAAMGQLRSVVRSYLFDTAVPGPVLDRVDQLLLGMRVPRSASLVLSTLTRSADGWSLAYSRAGHLPALLVRDGAVSELDGAGGGLIGFGREARPTSEVRLQLGDVLIYYTDGLIERRDRGLRDGLDALGRVAAAVTARDAAGIGEELLSRLADHTEDDVAVVVVRIPDPSDVLARVRSPRRRRWSLPSEAASIARARHAVVRTCEAWGIGDAANAELVVSELVANAVLHGWGHVTLQLYDTGDGLRIEVEDANPAPPVTTDGHPGRVGGFGMQIVARLSDWGWRQSRGGKLVWAKIRPGSLPSHEQG
ncbi:SpoIIE family protein phosphatase [Cellulomonas soli]|uniref:ATP-binding SpoIIE family protein phosphatase n=1 Tax=Cellulomonas soli TaxID=931535 RepID=UPI003F84DB62